MACREDVLRLYHRGLSPPDIAERLNCMSEYVRATLRRAGLSATQAEHRAKQIRWRLKQLDSERRDLMRELSELQQ
jgi:DNA-directed RNA polymerase specialized sigma24 family protein